MANRTASKRTDKAPSKRGEKGWQAEKSALTRQSILDATTQCIIDYGYAQTTTSLIAEQAIVSRGAMTHHFPSRSDVLKATIEYLHEKRLAEYTALMEGLGPPPKAMTRDKIALAVDLAWKFVNLPSSLAYQEILMASRTDPALKRVLEPLEKEFEENFLQVVKRAFPPWEGYEEIEMVHDAALFMLTGMMLSHMKSRKKVRTRHILEFLTDSVEQLHLKVVATDPKH